MCSAGTKKIFFKFVFCWCIFFIKDGVLYGVVYNRESPSRITGKSSFYKVLSDI